MDLPHCPLQEQPTSETRSSPFATAPATAGGGMLAEHGTRKFVAWGSTPRPGSRAASATLGHPNKPFGSARTARAPRALDLAAQGGGLSAAGRTELGGSARRAIDTRLRPDPYKDGLD